MLERFRCRGSAQNCGDTGFVNRVSAGGEGKPNSIGVSAPWGTLMTLILLASHDPTVLVTAMKRTLRASTETWWALTDSNPRPAECKWERFCREGSSMVAFVDIH